MMIITSTANGQIKHLQQLLKKSSLRKKEGLYVVEGWRSFLEVPKEMLSEVFVSESQSSRLDGTGIRPILVSDRVLESVSETQTSQGVIAIVRMKKASELKADCQGLYVLCEHLQDPGNLGTIIRMSEAAGVDAVILSEDTVDVYNPKVVRSTMGAILRVNVMTVPDIIATVAQLKERGVSVYGAALEDSRDYAEVDYTGGSAFVIGNEGNGLTEAIKKVCSGLVHIPMEGNVESLNASVAASVLTFEAYRQRRFVRKK